MAHVVAIASTSSEEGGRSTFSKREVCTKPRLSQKKKIIIIIIIIITYILFSKEKKKSYIYRQTLAITLIKKYIFNYIFCKFNY